MKIYVGHPSDIEYEKQLYSPIQESELAEKHNFVFPHRTEGQYNSKKFFKENCDLFIADVSEPSLGLGIEIGWADTEDVPIFCICKKNSDVSDSIFSVSSNLHRYKNSEELTSILAERL